MELNQIKKEFLSNYSLSSQCTKKKYLTEINLFCEVCDIKKIEDINNSNNEYIDKFYDYAKKQEWKDSTINQRLQSAKIFFAWMFKKGYIKQDPIADIKSIRTTNFVHYTPSTDDCDKLLDTIKTHTDKKRLYIMVKLMLCSGLRRSEICNLKISDINKTESTINVIGKGKKVKEQPIPSDIMIDIVEYINTERAYTIQKYTKMGGKDKGFLFVSGIGDRCNASKKDLTNGNKVNDNVLYQQIKRYAKMSGIEHPEKISPHALRRSAGTKLYNETHDIRTVSDFLRHSNISTTEQCYVDYDKNNLKTAINNTFGNTEFTKDDEYKLFLLLKKKFSMVGV